MNPADVAKLLDDQRPAVQNRAIEQLARAGAGAVPVLDDVLKTSASGDARRNAIWALTRIQGTGARESVRSALNDRDQSVRLAALHSVGLLRDVDAAPLLVDALKSGVAPVQRAAAEALGRIGDARAVADLLATAASPLDRTLEHSVIYALIEIGNPPATGAAARAAPSPAQRAALIALDQMDGGDLRPTAVIPLLDSTDPLLRETAWWIVGHRAEWGRALAEFFQTHLAAKDLGAAARDDLQRKLVDFADNAAIQELLAAVAERPASKDDREVALRAMARTRAKELPSSWIPSLVEALSSRDLDVTRLALSVARAAPPSKDAVLAVQTTLLRVARNAVLPLDVRLDALGAVHGGLTSVDPDLFDLLRTSLEPAQPVSVRVAAAGVLEKARLDREQLVRLTESLAHAGPLELPRLLPAFDRGSDEALGVEMLAALERSNGRSSVRADILRPRLAKYPESVQKRGEALLASLNVDAARQARRLDEILATSRAGDIRRGQAVFNSPKVGCLSCHSIGYLGGKIGPDLTRIGQVRSERDLLEAILFPSASFARGYEPVVVTTQSGEIRTGILRNELSDAIVLVSGAGTETRIPRGDIADMRPGTVSIMPPGLADQLSRQELADLLAFLKATQPSALPRD